MPWASNSFFPFQSSGVNRKHRISLLCHPLPSTDTSRALFLIATGLRCPIVSPSFEFLLLSAADFEQIDSRRGKPGTPIVVSITTTDVFYYLNRRTLP